MALTAEAAEATAEVSRPDAAESVAGAAASAKPVRVAAAPASTVEEKVVDAAVAAALVGVASRILAMMMMSRVLCHAVVHGNVVCF